MKHDWIKVEDRLPEADGRYLVVRIWNGEQRVQRARWSGTGWAADKDGNFPLITHWLPIPEGDDE